MNTVIHWALNSTSSSAEWFKKFTNNGLPSPLSGAQSPQQRDTIILYSK